MLRLAIVFCASSASLSAEPQIPDTPLTFGAFVARFGADGAFTLEGQGWPSFKGSFKADGDQIEVAVSDGPQACRGPGRYRFRIYLLNEDGEMLVIAAGPSFKHVATNSMGELLMATPALSDGVMYVRSSSSLFAIGRVRSSVEPTPRPHDKPGSRAGMRPEAR